MLAQAGLASSFLRKLGRWVSFFNDPQKLLCCDSNCLWPFEFQGRSAGSFETRSLKCSGGLSRWWLTVYWSTQPPWQGLGAKTSLSHLCGPSRDPMGPWGSAEQIWRGNRHVTQHLTCQAPQSPVEREMPVLPESPLSRALSLLDTIGSRSFVSGPSCFLFYPLTAFKLLNQSRLFGVMPVFGSWGYWAGGCLWSEVSMQNTWHVSAGERSRTGTPMHW